MKVYRRARRAFPFVLLFLLGVLTRLPFRSRFLYHWDSVNFALGMEHFDVYLHQPQPPGYFLYVMLGRAVDLWVGDANRSLVWISVLSSGVAAALMYRLGRSLWDVRTGWLAAFLFLTGPLFWFHGEVALSYIVEAAFVTLIALLCYRHLIGAEDRAWLSALVLGLAGGFRPNTMLFLLPLWASSVWRLRWQRVMVAVTVLMTTTVAWLVPMLIFTGGVERYWEATTVAGRSVGEESPLLGVEQVVTNGARLMMFIGYALGISLIPGFVGFGLWVKSGWRKFWAWRNDVRLRFFAWWVLPSLFFYIGVHIRQPGHSFTIMPALLLVLGSLLARMFSFSGHCRHLCLCAILGLAVGLNTVIFLVAPPFPFGVQRITLTIPSQLAIRSRDTSLEMRLAYIRAHFPATSTVILSSGLDFRHPDFYLREYPRYRYAATSITGFTERLVLSPSITTVVLFGNGLRAEDCQTVDVGEGYSLCVIRCEPGQAVIVEGTMVRLSPSRARQSQAESAGLSALAERME